MHNMGGMSKQDTTGTETTKLFVGNLALQCNEMDLTRLCNQFGTLKLVEVKRGVTGESLLHGFVKFESPAAAATAIFNLDNYKFMGRRLRVNWATTRAGSDSPLESERQEQDQNWTQVHVRFSTREVDIPINEALLDALFSQFGEVADVSIKHPLRTNHKQRQQKNGYGFVFFYDRRVALQAVQAMRNRLMDNVLFDCDLSHRSLDSRSASRDDEDAENNVEMPVHMRLAGPRELMQRLANDVAIFMPQISPTGAATAAEPIYFPMPAPQPPMAAPYVSYSPPPQSGSPPSAYVTVMSPPQGYMSPAPPPMMFMAAAAPPPPPPLQLFMGMPTAPASAAGHSPPHSFEGQMQYMPPPMGWLQSQPPAFHQAGPFHFQQQQQLPQYQQQQQQQLQSPLPPQYPPLQQQPGYYHARMPYGGVPYYDPRPMTMRTASPSSTTVNQSFYIPTTPDSKQQDQQDAIRESHSNYNA